jgi:7,8-dihydropterin-6-yl-methyl-4-(beta-D-ribofuranosyl)aminobenzene 5'-phosphate synthase
MTEAEPKQSFADMNAKWHRGGFHIVPPLSDEYIRQVITAFKDMNPDYLIPGHCAGERFYDLVRAEMPDKVIHAAVGARFVFGT